MKSNIDNQKARRYIQKKVRQRMAIVAEYIETAAKLLAPVDTGNLRGSIRGSVPNWFTAQVGTSLNYAAQVEFGGTIKPKGKPFGADALTIPLSKEAKLKNAGEFSDLFVLKTKTGKAFLVQDLGGGNLVFHYLLAKKVTQKAKPFLRPAIYNRKSQIAQILKGGVK
jgi:hypothetical protein